jgi:hypothetical protein
MKEFRMAYKQFCKLVDMLSLILKNKIQILELQFLLIKQVPLHCTDLAMEAQFIWLDIPWKISHNFI